MARKDSMSLAVTSLVLTRCPASCSTVPGTQVSVPPATRGTWAYAAIFTSPASVSILTSRVIVWFVLGYAMYAAVGSLASRAEDAANVAAPVS